MNLEQSPRLNLDALALIEECLDAKMRQVADLIKRYADCKIVLIVGETGVGKDVIARALHQKGNRNSSELVTIDCSNLNRNLMGSELFGHEKGAFTDAYERKTGLFETAQKGTAFLDEIGELPLDMQPRLLRVLQGQHFHRVGGNEPIKPDFRLIAASNGDLFHMAQKGTFRRDLFYRLEVFVISVPPLRERTGDLLRLANQFVHTLSAGKKSLTECAKEKILKHRWPGNVRELENAISRSVVITNDHSTISSEHIQINPGDWICGKNSQPLTDPALVREYFVQLAETLAGLPEDELKGKGLFHYCENYFQKALIEWALQKNSFKIQPTAALLGVTRPTLYDRIEKLDIDVQGLKYDQFKDS